MRFDKNTMMMRRMCMGMMSMCMICNANESHLRAVC